VAIAFGDQVTQLRVVLLGVALTRSRGLAFEEERAVVERQLVFLGQFAFGVGSRGT